MSLTSVLFIILFLPTCILSNYFIKDKYRNALLCIFSIIFYSWCGIKFLFLILISSTLAYVFGVLIRKIENSHIKRCILIISLIYNVGILFFYKYLFNLFPNVINLSFNENASLILPLGISFYSLSIISYILDVYWQKCKPQTNIINLYLYILFFPKVIQGPIMRYSDYEKQLNDITIDISKLNDGIERFIKGMFKKIIIADHIGLLVTYSFSNVNEIGTISAWVGILAYLLQLYYDFSGYTDMAIGLGLMVGFNLPENFDHPYMSNSVSEYWRRWHISLGEWLKNYIYTPCSRAILNLKFNSKLEKNKMFICDVIALLVTWLIAGIWHGSEKKYIVYGLWWFVFITYERIRTKHRKRIRKEKKLSIKEDNWWQKISNRTITIVAIVFGQVIFKSDSLNSAIIYMKKMILWNKGDGVLFLTQFDNLLVFSLIIGIIFVFPTYSFIKNKIVNKYLITKLIFKIMLILIAFVSFTYIVSKGYTAFLYEIF